MECISLCAWHILFLYFVSQCMHSCIEPSLHGVDFFFMVADRVTATAPASAAATATCFASPRGGDALPPCGIAAASATAVNTNLRARLQT